ncbi:PREDICTED: uncharacterized protein LOC105560116 isoform X2 [Vollenhovia emeryi]|nr:PREDICTED: uncharacterized protein LOC105560116 isoform X2 [Vollenhovia emeryi]
MYAQLAGKYPTLCYQQFRQGPHSKAKSNVQRMKEEKGECKKSAVEKGRSYKEQRSLFTWRQDGYLRSICSHLTGQH